MQQKNTTNTTKTTNTINTTKKLDICYVLLICSVNMLLLFP